MHRDKGEGRLGENNDNKHSTGTTYTWTLARTSGCPNITAHMKKYVRLLSSRLADQGAAKHKPPRQTIYREMFATCTIFFPTDSA